MFKYQLINEVIVVLNVTSGNEKSKIIYEGDLDSIAVIRNFLETSYGAFGHIIGDATTPIDLHYAFSSKQAQQFQPKLLEGEDLVKSYNPEIPDNAVT
ncbi:MAG: hypothetical protein V7L23_29835 [Nostoc sp.]|uniref:hypothetical protein n=1 Tax=Nostoc sp. TaxID=1180 RepID=UPI002FF03819